MIRRSFLWVMVVGLSVTVATHSEVYGMQKWLANGVKVAQESAAAKWCAETGGDFARWSVDSAGIAWSMLNGQMDQTAAITASSPILAYRMCDFVKGDSKVLELGAGHGSLSVPVARMFAEKAEPTRFDIVECNEAFYNCLNARVAQFGKPNHEVYTYRMLFGAEWKPRDINDATGYYDTVLSTLPWTRMNADMQRTVQERITEVLKSKGKLIWVSLAGAKVLGAVKAAIKGDKELVEYSQEQLYFGAWIQENFESVTEHFVPWNVTPMRVYVAIKK